MPDVPDALKTHNWTLYEQAMSADPSIASQYIGKLITSLQITMKVAGVTEFDDMLEYESRGARRAWYEYTQEKNAGRAMQTVTVVLTKVGPLVYDPRFANTHSKAFTGR